MARSFSETPEKRQAEIIAKPDATLRCLAHPGIALPLDFGHLSRGNLDIERAVATDSFLLIFLCDGVMTGRERNFKMALSVGREFCYCAAFIADNKRRIGQRLRADHARSDRARMSRGKRNHAFNSCFSCLGHWRG